MINVLKLLAICFVALYSSTPVSAKMHFLPDYQESFSGRSSDYKYDDDRKQWEDQWKDQGPNITDGLEHSGKCPNGDIDHDSVKDKISDRICIISGSYPGIGICYSSCKCNRVTYQYEKNNGCEPGYNCSNECYDGNTYYKDRTKKDCPNDSKIKKECPTVLENGHGYYELGSPNDSYSGEDACYPCKLICYSGYTGVDCSDITSCSPGSAINAEQCAPATPTNGKWTLGRENGEYSEGEPCQICEIECDDGYTLENDSCVPADCPDDYPYTSETVPTDPEHGTYTENGCSGKSGDQQCCRYTLTCETGWTGTDCSEAQSCPPNSTTDTECISIDGGEMCSTKLTSNKSGDEFCKEYVVSCNNGYEESNGGCVAKSCEGYLASCPDKGVCNNTCLSGTTKKYKLTGCDSGYTLINDSCVQNTVSSGGDDADDGDNSGDGGDNSGDGGNGGDNGGTVTPVTCTYNDNDSCVGAISKAQSCIKDENGCFQLSECQEGYIPSGNSCVCDWGDYTLTQKTVDGAEEYESKKCGEETRYRVSKCYDEGSCTYNLENNNCVFAGEVLSKWLSKSACQSANQGAGSYGCTKTTDNHWVVFSCTDGYELQKPNGTCRLDYYCKACEWGDYIYDTKNADHVETWDDTPKECGNLTKYRIADCEFDYILREGKCVYKCDYYTEEECLAGIDGSSDCNADSNGCYVLAACDDGYMFNQPERDRCVLMEDDEINGDETCYTVYSDCTSSIPNALTCTMIDGCYRLLDCQLNYKVEDGACVCDWDDYPIEEENRDTERASYLSRECDGVTRYKFNKCKYDYTEDPEGSGECVCIWGEYNLEACPENAHCYEKICDGDTQYKFKFCNVDYQLVDNECVACNWGDFNIIQTSGTDACPDYASCSEMTCGIMTKIKIDSCEEGLKISDSGTRCTCDVPDGYSSYKYDYCKSDNKYICDYWTCKNGTEYANIIDCAEGYKLYGDYTCKSVSSSDDGDGVCDFDDYPLETCPENAECYEKTCDDGIRYKFWYCKSPYTESPEGNGKCVCDWGEYTLTESYIDETKAYYLKKTCGGDTRYKLSNCKYGYTESQEVSGVCECDWNGDLSEYNLEACPDNATCYEKICDGDPRYKLGKCDTGYEETESGTCVCNFNDYTIAGNDLELDKAIYSSHTCGDKTLYKFSSCKYGYKEDSDNSGKCVCDWKEYTLTGDDIDETRAYYLNKTCGNDTQYKFSNCKYGYKESPENSGKCVCDWGEYNLEACPDNATCMSKTCDGYPRYKLGRCHTGYKEDSNSGECVCDWDGYLSEYTIEEKDIEPDKANYSSYTCGGDTRYKFGSCRFDYKESPAGSGVCECDWDGVLSEYNLEACPKNGLCTETKCDGKTRYHLVTCKNSLYRHEGDECNFLGIG